MNDNIDIRWMQRFQNFENAFRYLQEMANRETYSEVDIDATIQRFEVTFELAWKVLQDYLEEEGYTEYRGPKKVLAKAFQDSILVDGETWMRMHEDRNILSHAYDHKTSREIFRRIISIYLPAIEAMYTKLKNERDSEVRT